MYWLSEHFVRDCEVQHIKDQLIQRLHNTDRNYTTMSTGFSSTCLYVYIAVVGKIETFRNIFTTPIKIVLFSETPK